MGSLQFFIPAGTLHAICKGIVIAEIQQNSNVTYRVYDYGRLGADGRPRALHINQAVDVTQCCPPPPTRQNFGGHLARCDYFTVDRFEGTFTGQCGRESFVSLLVVEGAGTLACGGETAALQKGGSFLLPAGSGVYTVTGDATVIRTCV